MQNNSHPLITACQLLLVSGRCNFCNTLNSTDISDQQILPTMNELILQQLAEQVPGCQSKSLFLLILQPPAPFQKSISHANPEV